MCECKLKCIEWIQYIRRSCTLIEDALQQSCPIYFYQYYCNVTIFMKLAIYVEHTLILIAAVRFLCGIASHFEPPVTVMVTPSSGTLRTDCVIESSSPIEVGFNPTNQQ